MTDDIVAAQPAKGRRYVGVAVVPRRRRQIERALERVVELGGEAFLITADGSDGARGAGVEHVDLLNAEMSKGPNRLIAVSPKRVAGKLVGKKVGGRSYAWQRWMNSRPYKTVRFYGLWHVLKPGLADVHVDRVTDVLLAGVESWPITWHLAALKPDITIGWDVPDPWKRPVEDEVLGLRRVAVWGSEPSWTLMGRSNFADAVTVFAASSWLTQASGPAGDRLTGLLPESVEEDQELALRSVGEDMRSTVVDGIIEAAPDAVLLDLGNELVDLVDIDGWRNVGRQYAELGIADAASALAEGTLAWDAPERDELFAQAVRAIAPRLRAALPDSWFFIHTGWLRHDKDHESIPGRYGPRLAAYENIVREALGERVSVLAPPAELQVLTTSAAAKASATDLFRAYQPAYFEALMEEMDATLRAEQVRPAGRPADDEVDGPVGGVPDDA